MVPHRMPGLAMPLNSYCMEKETSPPAAGGQSLPPPPPGRCCAHGSLGDFLSSYVN